MATENERALDLGPPADPRDLWPRLPLFDQMPRAWTRGYGGDVKEVRIVGRVGDRVIYAYTQESKDRPWICHDANAAEVSPTEAEARAGAIEMVREKLEQELQKLQKLIMAAGVVVEPASAKYRRFLLEK